MASVAGFDRSEQRAFGGTELSFRLMDRCDHIVTLCANPGFCQTGDPTAVLRNIVGDGSEFSGGGRSGSGHAAKP